MSRKNLDLSHTIFALSSGRLPSAVAIEKISGPDAFSIAVRLLAFKGEQALVRERAMRFGFLKDARGKLFDDVMVLSFVAPHSHTGQDTIEIHCHGSVAIVYELEKLLLELGARPAERGEFSYRAFLNNKVSGHEIDSLGDVFLARQPADLQRIYSRKDGALELQISELRSSLVQVQAILDTAVDFSDEYSSVVDHAQKAIEIVSERCALISQRYSQFKSGRRTPRLVLAGRPNAGKSSLFNSLLCRYRAIVHDEPGTTRDVIEEEISIDGKIWKLADTAGIRETQNRTEQQGLALGEDYLAASDCWILVVDGSVGISHEERELLIRFGEKPHLILWNKCDLPNWRSPGLAFHQALAVSATTGQNVEVLLSRLNGISHNLAEDADAPLPTAIQSSKLDSVSQELGILLKELNSGVPPEFIAEHNRLLTDKLDDVIGSVDGEDVLNRIFNEFCIGK